MIMKHFSLYLCKCARCKCQISHKQTVRVLMNAIFLIVTFTPLYLFLANQTKPKLQMTGHLFCTLLFDPIRVRL